MSDLPFVLAAFLAGMLAVPHCLAMCGALAGGFCALLAPAPGRAALLVSLKLNLGRVAGYALLGMLAGGGGQLLYAGLALERAALLARTLTALALILLALAIAFPRLRLSMPLAEWAVRPVHRAVHRLRSLSPLALGAAWSLLPCGLSFAALLAAFTIGSALAGAALMSAFGLGTLAATLPASLGLSFADRPDPSGKRRRLALLLALAGLFALIMPWWMPPPASAENALIGPMCHGARR